jgi:glyoxylase-like metal-dependent hydrolase (beta-lactamase superfamily II)
VINVKLTLLCDGFLTMDKSFLVYMKYTGQPYEAALKTLLIQTGKENILVDTGAGELPEKLQKFYKITRKPEQNLKAQLAQHGLEPEDIDTVVNTHLHFDHCGNNILFPHAKFIVQAEEYDYALKPERFQEAAYAKELFDFKANRQLINEEFRLTDEIQLVPTQGHSIGHQSAIVKTADGNLVYCGDAAPLKENLERRNIPGVLHCPHHALEAIDRLKAIDNAVYIYSHDNEQLTL